MIKKVPSQSKKTVSFSELPVTSYDQELSSVAPPALKVQTNSTATAVANVSNSNTQTVI